MFARNLVAAVAVIAFTSSLASAHQGRRFEVVVVDNQLAAQGYNSLSADDGAGIVRPYYNVLHGHWDNLGPAGSAAIADLPGFDVFNDTGSFVMANSHFDGGAAADLLGADLTLELVGAHKWTTPSHHGPVTLEPLTASDPVITINRFGADPSEAINSNTLGTLLLASNIGAGGATDLDLDYTIDDHPSGIIYALEWVLSADNGLAPSESLYTLHAPDPMSGMALHHAALNAERRLGIAVPEPATASGVCLLLLGAAGIRRRRLAVGEGA